MKMHLLRASALAGAAGLMITGQALAQTTPQTDENAVEALVVTGSRIPRIATEGPAPVTVITSENIKAAGFNSVPDVLRSLTQNGGETQTQQSSSGADWTPGAQQVDLRGLGPNHTLVLVNGRRIADFPLPFNGKSAFTDTSSIPLGMIDRIEVLSGSASAVYGSDAISGVVNFNLKKKVDGTTVDVTFGGLEHGGASSQRMNVSTGYSKGDFDLVIGGEFVNQKPLWAYDRDIQDSTRDAPTARARIARRDFLRIDPDAEEYVDPGKATCATLSKLNGGSVEYASRPGWGAYDADLDDYGPGYYCGSYSSIGYGTIISERKSANVVASLNYAKTDDLSFFADISAGYSRTRQFQDVLDWEYQDANGSEDGIFYNQFTGALDLWHRNFTPEEMGGLSKGYIKNVSRTFSITPGVKGALGGGWLVFKNFRKDYLWLILPPAIFFAASLTVKVQIGYRHILPVMPFIAMLAGLALARLLEIKKGAWLVAGLLALNAASVLRAHPHYLAYFNEPAGGPSNGYRLFVDSNLDWGQDVQGVADYLKSRGNPPVVFSYFGVARPESYGIAYVPLGIVSNVELKGTGAQVCGMKEVLLAVSVTNLQGTYYSDKETFSWLKTRSPVVTPGHSIFVYDLSSDKEGLGKLASLFDREGRNAEADCLYAKAGK